MNGDVRSAFASSRMWVRIIMVPPVVANGESVPGARGNAFTYNRLLAGSGRDLCDRSDSSHLKGAETA